ncbi:SusC/RagA family TonB-linked outer membrane protein [Fodinibius sediminis]|uniref:TonB-linked outer membrane protein, SusC/RagA family n=1 Tax=Fodinibius sediminis TaxID=1214077 RepID=A0A521AN26_9BACT|nr:SusC/RagA family TonB-linked outer membrane protein [Fodinibius sediminis]SMO36192.1 TonB-linked outer membrane protein, SusC/RagA family [Fodinibius sediminis]
MFRKLLYTAIMCLISVGTAFAQTGSLSGTVTDAGSGEALPGANVVIAELSTGSSVNADGEYEITNIPAGTYEVTVSFIGYNQASRSVTITANEETVENFELQSGINLDEVVVTALGEEVTQRRVSFSTQEVSEEQLNVSQDANIKTGLAGKIAGVQMVGQAGSKLGDFGNIRIRGAISLTDDLAEPLYVIDGVPTENPNIIDMNNVQDVNVLKGPNATALYGQRGENGVVIITTKASGQSGVSVELNSATTFDVVSYLPNFQNQYGKGYSGEGEWTTLNFSDGYSGFPYPDYLEPLDGERYIFNGYADESWGPKFDGEPYIAWYNMYPDSPYYGETSTWDAAENNIKNFYETGVTNKTGLAINYSTDRYNTRLAFTNLTQGGILPYSDLNKQFLNGSFNYDVTDDFNVGLKVNYTTQSINGDVRNDDYGNQTSGSFNSWFARNLEMDKMRELKDLQTPEGYSASWNNWGPGFMALAPLELVGGPPSEYFKPAFWYNPYTWMDRYDETRNTDNLLMNVDLSYQLSDQFELVGNASTTYEDFKYRFELPYSLSYSSAPTLYNAWVNSFGEYGDETKEHNFSSRLRYDASFDDWTVNAFVGGQVRIQSYKRLSAEMDDGNWQNGGLILPDVYTFANSAEQVIPVERNWDKKVLSMFAKATIGYQDFLYLDGTYRQDYSSALPEGNNGYGYPSVGLSFIFSEFIESDVLTSGKLRAGWAQVGNDVDAELINQVYFLQQDPFTNPETGAANPLLYTDETLVDPNIKPALSSSFEIGTDLGFFNDRIGLDVTYYFEERQDEIVPTSLSAGTGYTEYLTNAGSLEREGVEIALNATPVSTQDFRWSTTLNWAKNSVVVTELPEGLDSYEMANTTAAFGYVTMTHKLNEEWGQLRGPGIRRNENGQPVVNPNGLYAVEQNQYFGSVLPDWTGGFLNTFAYKGLSLTASIDFQKGGKFFTLSEQWGQYSGLLEETAGKNDLGNLKRDDAWNYDADGNPTSLVEEENRGGVHVTGVDAEGNPVDTYVEAIDYYGQWQANTIAEPFIHDADFVKLRELSLNYTLPKEWIGNFLQSATVGVVGRNLWMIAVSDDNVHGWDPSELAQTYGENGQLPGTKSYGFNVKVTF